MSAPESMVWSLNSFIVPVTKELNSSSLLRSLVEPSPISMLGSVGNILLKAHGVTVSSLGVSIADIEDSCG